MLPVHIFLFRRKKRKKKEDEWLKKMYKYTRYTMENYSAMRRMKFCHMKQDIHLECIMLHEISQTERQILYDITYMWNLKNTTNK